MGQFDFLFDLEKQLHSFEVRSDRAKISALLSPNFFEFGSSGKIWTLDAVLENLPTEDGDTEIQSSGFKAHELSSDVVLITYISKRVLEGKELGSFLRSSIWRKNQNKWFMEFHQGTPESINFRY